VTQKLHAFLLSAINEGQCSASRSGRFAQYALNRKLVEPNNRMADDKNQTSSENRTSVVAIIFNDYSNPAHNMNKLGNIRQWPRGSKHILSPTARKLGSLDGTPYKERICVHVPFVLVMSIDDLRWG
jgi:hypothetical protein